MRYEDKFLEHFDNDGYPPIKEVIVTVEFSTSDLLELKKVLLSANANTWNYVLVDKINKSLEKIGMS